MADLTGYRVRVMDLLLRKGGPQAPAPGGYEEPGAGAEATAEQERWLRCVTCRAPIARESARMVVCGKHEHEFMNPSGIRYVVRCFSSAPGCMPVGERSTVWTWFPGHAWQIEICRSCLDHLGWSFHGAGSFYGLVRERLA